MPEPLQRCYKKVLKKAKGRGLSDERAEAFARGVCAASTKLQWKHADFDEGNMYLESLGKIMETDNGRYAYYGGTAIPPGVSKNKVEYTREVLAASYKSLEGTPFFGNHDTFKPPVGEVVSADLRENGEIGFVAEIDEKANPEHFASLESGYIKRVSVGSEPLYGAECTVCGEEYGEGCSHYRGQKVKVKGKMVEVHVRPRRQIQFNQLASVYYKAGFDQAKIQHIDTRVPMILENYIEIEHSKVKKMSEIEEKLNERIKELESEKAALEEDAKEVSVLQKQFNESREQNKHYKAQERQRMCRQISLIEIEVKPDVYTMEKQEAREKELMEGKMQEAQLQERLKTLEEMRPPPPTSLQQIKKELQTKAPPPRAPPSNEYSEEAVRVRINLEAKRLVERALRFKKPLDPKFQEYVEDNELSFKPEREEDWFAPVATRTVPTRRRSA